MDGYHGDNCGTIVVGHANTIEQYSTTAGSTSSISGVSGSNQTIEQLNAIKLVQTTKYALESSITKLGPGICLSVIGITTNITATTTLHLLCFYMNIYFM